MSYEFQKRYYFWLFFLFLACAPDSIDYNNYTYVGSKLKITETQGLKFNNSSIVDGTQFNFKTESEGTYTLEIRDHFRTLISKSKLTAKVGDNIYSFYTRALQQGDYTITIKQGTNKVQETKMTIQ